MEAIVAALVKIALDPTVDKYILGILKGTFVAVRNNWVNRKVFRLKHGITDPNTVVNHFHLFGGHHLSAFLEQNTNALLNSRICSIVRNLYARAGRSIVEANTHLVGAQVADPYADWMGTLLPADATFFNTVLPSSHDSGASSFNFDKVLGTSTLCGLGKIPLLRKFLIASAQTTSQTILQQLLYGIRVLDFRVSFYPSDGQYYLSHTFCTNTTLVGAIYQVTLFLSQHPREVVLIRVKKDSENTYFPEPSGHFAVGKIIIDRSGSLLYPPTTTGGSLTRNTTFSSMGQQRLVVAYQDYPQSGDPYGSSTYLWNTRTLLDEPWYNISDPLQNTSDIVNHLNSITFPNSVLVEAAFVLTPQTSDVVKSVLLYNTKFARNPVDLAKLEATQLAGVMATQASLLRTKANFITTDFALESNLVSTVLDLNGLSHP
jgi:hypothetical protein